MEREFVERLRRSAWAICLVVGVGLGACGNDGEQSRREADLGPLETLPEVPLTGADPAVVDQLSSARQHLDSLAEQQADADELGAAYGRLGQLYHAYDLLEPAGICYRNAARLDPQSFRWAYYLGSLYRRQGQLQEAQLTIETALAIDSDSPQALLLLGNLELLQDRPQDAEPRFERALQLDQRCLAARYGLGEAARARGAYEEAVRHYERILDEQPAATQVHYPLGQALQRLGRQDEATPHLEKGEVRRGRVGGRPGCPDPLEQELRELKTGAAVHMERGLRAGHAGDLARELQEYQRAVALSPEDAIVRQGLASALYRTGDFHSAAAEFRQAIRLAPENPNYHYDLGLALLQLGSGEEAAASFRVSLEVDPDYRDAALKLAEIELQSGDAQEVIRLADRVVRLDPGSSRARSLRTMAYLKLNRRAEATTELRTLLVDYPPTDAGERLRLAMILATLGDLSVAEDQIRTILALDLDPPLAARAHLARGQLHLSRGAIEAAVTDFRQALELDPQLAAAQAALARIQGAGEG
jgi:tetratricopeptide (TPR) repeat protein